MSATLLTHGPPSNIRGGIEARAPKRKASPECISATITLVVPFVLALQVLRGISISPTAMLETMDNAKRFFIRVDGGSLSRRTNCSTGPLWPHPRPSAPWTLGEWRFWLTVSIP